MVISAKIEAEMTDILKELADVRKVRTIDVKIVDDVLALTRDIATTYKEGDTNARRAYLNFFFSKILLENKKITNIQYQPVIDVLNKANLGILATNGLKTWDSYRRIDWINEIEYPELIYQETQKFLSARFASV